MLLTRRDLLKTVPVALAAQSVRDRRSLVQRHNPTITAIDARSPLSVGNGEFCFDG